MTGYHNLGDTFEDDYDSDLASRSTSSTLSWTDEIDNDATYILRKRFLLFDAVLYGEEPIEKLTHLEQEECELWKNHSTYLRVIGKKKIIHVDTNYEDGNESGIEEVFAVHPVKPNERLAPSEELTFRACHNKKTNSVYFHDKLLPHTSNEISNSLHEWSLENEFSKNLKLNGTSCLDNLHSPQSARNYLKVDNCLLPQMLDKHFSNIDLDNSNLDGRKKQIYCPKGPPSSGKLTSQRVQNKYEYKKHRHGVLPPIETFSLTPKINKRATSALLQFTRAQPGVRPFTTRNKTVYLVPLNTLDVTENKNNQRSISNPLIQERPNNALSLPLSFKKVNKKNVLPQVEHPVTPSCSPNS